jgi:hypothetical protein
MNAPKSADQLYGFTDYMNPKQGIPNDDDQNYQQSAMQVMRIDSMMNELVSLGDVHGNAPNRMFENQINYGNQPGAIQVVVSPYGSLKIQIRSLVNDNLGNPSYILRKCIPLVNDFNHFKTKIGEDAVAGYVYDQALKFSKMKLEYPIPKYNDLETLIKYLAARLREQHPLIMMYAATYRENDNYADYDDYDEPYSCEYPITRRELASIPADMRAVFDPEYQSALANFRAAARGI